MNPKPRIFILITSLNIGGTEKFLLTVVMRLRHSFDFTIGYLKENGAIGEQLEGMGLPVTRFSSVGSLIRYVRSQRFHVMHTFLYRANIIGRVVAALAGVPVRISTRQSIDLWRKPWQILLDRWTEPMSTCIMANAAATRSLLIDREHVRAEKIRVIYNGIDLAGFTVTESRTALRCRWGIPADAFLVISVMRLHREKGADYLPQIIAGVPDAYFLVVGDGPERPHLEAAIKNVPGRERVILAGWQQAIADYLNAADVFLLPSREESLPQAVLEAMALRLPVIAANVGGVSELVADGVTGCLVEPGDITAYQQAVRTALQNREMLRDQGIRGFEKAAQFTEDRMIAAMADLYRTAGGGSA
jgi:glycosyltransferase involved in cell wall biosynthesis